MPVLTRTASGKAMHISPTARRHIRRHNQAHTEIVETRHWYSDDPPFLGKAFTAAKTAERSGSVRDILARKYQAISQGKSLHSDPHGLLWDRLASCSHRRRCGSL